MDIYSLNLNSPLGNLVPTQSRLWLMGRQEVSWVPRVLGSSTQLYAGFLFSKHVGVRGSNEVEVLALLDALSIVFCISLRADNSE